LLIGRKFSPSRSCFGNQYGAAFLWRERYGRLVAAGKLKHNAGNVILGVRREVAHGVKRSIKKFSH
jgi:hypothetical protein